MKGMKKGIVVVILAAALLVSMLGTASAASQLWYLDSKPHTVSGKTIMEKTIGTQSGDVTISKRSSQIWLAEHDAECDVTIPDGGFWVIVLWTDGNWTKDCDTEIGGYNSSTGWYDIPTTLVFEYWDKPNLSIEILLHSEDSTIYKDDYLALRINNTGSKGHTVDTDGRSSLTSPSTDPGYPVPELPTIVLTSIGLLALAGYVGWRRKKNS